MSRPKKGMLPVDAVEDRARALDLRKKIANTQDAQFINKVFQFTPKQRDAYAAIEALQNLREQEAEMFDERARRPRGMLPVPPSQADVRRLDNAQVDRWGRTEAGPDADYFGDHRDTFHAQTQQHIDHISARAHHAAEILKKRGTLKGSGYETAAKDFDDWFGPGSFKEHYLGR